MRTFLKQILHVLFLAAAMPLAVMSLFGRVKPTYTFFSQFCAMVPGGVGDYLRVAYYHLTLSECAMSSRISFGSFFAHPEARIGERVYIGSYCVMGRAIIGDGTQVASAAQILSGQHQHIRDSAGQFHEGGKFVFVTVGPNCWIGAAAIVMADVGAGTTIGASSVVTQPIPSNSVAVGSPARVIKSSEAAGDAI